MRPKLFAVTLAAGLISLTACGDFGQVSQGRVIAYDAAARRVTLIPEGDSAGSSSPGVLPPVTVDAPANPAEMGPAPSAGGLMKVDAKKHTLVIYNRISQAFQTVVYTPLGEKTNVAKKPGPPVVDRAAKTITFYAAADKRLITFAAPEELLSLPANTWQSGDVVRYYYKNPTQALRMMNVTKTDLSKSG